MIKRFLFIFMFFCLGFRLSGSPCDTLNYSAISESKSDSILYLFNIWQSKCGLCEPLQRAKIIYCLKNNSYHDSILGDSISCSIMIYLDRRHHDYFNNERYFSFVPIGKEFDTYTDSIATSMLNRYKKKSVEYLLCELYSNKSDSILIKTRSLIYKNCKIHNSPCNAHFKKIRSDNRDKSLANIALISGIWIPTGGLRVLGVHPELGFQCGLKKIHYSAQFTFIIKFLDSPGRYDAKRVHSNDSIESTHQFVGPYIGLDFSKSILTRNRNEFQILAGIGFDAFTALDPIKGSGRYEDVRSYNINFGLGYKFYFKKNKSYIGFEPKFNIVDYSLTGVTKLKGNFISVRFIYGHIDNLDFRNKGIKKNTLH